jgi:hypothetical protein
VTRVVAGYLQEIAIMSEQGASEFVWREVVYMSASRTVIERIPVIGLPPIPVRFFAKAEVTVQASGRPIGVRTFDIPLPDAATVEDAFRQHDEVVTAMQPNIKAQIQHELQHMQAAAATPRIVLPGQSPPVSLRHRP